MKRSALLVIDMLNTLDFPEGRQLLRHALPAGRNILRLKQKAAARKVPVIYVNDNFGRWRSSWEQVHEICLGSRGGPLARLLKPAPEDYFVLKPRNSGFFSTTLDPLLRDLRVRRLILTGIAGNICVLYTAHDAHMRGYELVVPSDCIASNTARENQMAIAQMRAAIPVKTPSWRRVEL
jgi:nicotinamidase-related amidase